jgi:transcription elongation factor Elf1
VSDTPDNVVPLDSRRRSTPPDDAAFLTCPVCGGDEFAVVCRGLPATPFVAALLCATCDPVVEIAVEAGELRA